MQRTSGQGENKREQFWGCDATYFIGSSNGAQTLGGMAWKGGPFERSFRD